jgi:hypothetical protein
MNKVKKCIICNCLFLCANNSELCRKYKKCMCDECYIKRYNRTVPIECNCKIIRSGNRGD